MSRPADSLWRGQSFPTATAVRAKGRGIRRSGTASEAVGSVRTRQRNTNGRDSPAASTGRASKGTYHGRPSGTTINSSSDLERSETRAFEQCFQQAAGRGFPLLVRKVVKRQFPAVLITAHLPEQGPTCCPTPLRRFHLPKVAALPVNHEPVHRPLRTDEGQQGLTVGDGCLDLPPRSEGAERPFPRLPAQGDLAEPASCCQPSDDNCSSCCLCPRSSGASANGCFRKAATSATIWTTAFHIQGDGGALRPRKPRFGPSADSGNSNSQRRATSRPP